MDLTKTIITSDTNAFKNVDSYPGSINFPTALGASETVKTSTTIPMQDAPVYSNFSAYFLEFTDAFYGIGAPRWYDSRVGAIWVAVLITTPAYAGYTNGSIYPVISGNSITVYAEVTNPYIDPLTLQALNVPFNFVEYTADS